MEIEDQHNQPIRLVSIDFKNYKALSSFQLTLHRTNILVGPNNYGKSTIIGALRILASALRKAHAKSPEWVQYRSERRLGYEISADSIPISLENVHTDYSSEDTTVTFRFSNDSNLILFFPTDGGCRLIPSPNGPLIRTPAAFKQAFPFKIAAIPVLGPMEHREALLKKETVQQNLLTHRASRHFRNYWYHFPEGFDDFAALVRSTWPGMNIRRPKMENLDPIEIYMFAEENRMSRELYWCGFGFQIWCQLLTHISRNRDADLLIVDEPEVYLHPDVQRQLLGVLNDAGPSVILATHSTEIMAEAEPSDIVLVDKERGSGRRLQNAAALQSAFAHVGSIHTLTLAQAARNRRVLYVSDIREYALLKRFAQVSGCHEFAGTSSITPLASGGTRAWQEIRSLARRIEEATDVRFRVAVIYGREFHQTATLASISNGLAQYVDFAWILGTAQLENYLLVPSILDRVIAGQIAVTGRTGPSPEDIGSQSLLDVVTCNIEEYVRNQWLAQLANSDCASDDQPTPDAIMVKFEQDWADLPTRLKMVPGRSVLSTFRSMISERYGVSFSDTSIADSFTKDELTSDLKALLAGLESFARQ